MEFEMVYYYNFDPERGTKMHYQVNFVHQQLKPQEHLGYRYEVIRLKNVEDERKYIIIALDHCFKEEVEIVTVTEVEDRLKI